MSCRVTAQTSLPSMTPGQAVRTTLFTQVSFSMERYTSTRAWSRSSERRSPPMPSNTEMTTATAPDLNGPCSTS